MDTNICAVALDHNGLHHIPRACALSADRARSRSDRRRPGKAADTRPFLRLQRRPQGKARGEASAQKQKATVEGFNKS